MNFNNRSVALQIEVPNLKELPSIMNNFNQLVMAEYKILKMFICFDMPLSILNRIQVESISDLDNYLMAKSMSIQQSSEHKTTDKKQKSSDATASNSTPVTNLLHEFRAQQTGNVLETIKEDVKVELRKNLDADEFSQIPLCTSDYGQIALNYSQSPSTSHTSGLNTA